MLQGSGLPLQEATTGMADSRLALRWKIRVKPCDHDSPASEIPQKRPRPQSEHSPSFFVRESLIQSGQNLLLILDDPVEGSLILENGRLIF